MQDLNKVAVQIITKHNQSAHRDRFGVVLDAINLDDYPTLTKAERADLKKRLEDMGFHVSDEPKVSEEEEPATDSSDKVEAARRRRDEYARSVCKSSASDSASTTALDQRSLGRPRTVEEARRRRDERSHNAWRTPTDGDAA